MRIATAKRYRMGDYDDSEFADLAEIARLLAFAPPGKHCSCLVSHEDDCPVGRAITWLRLHSEATLP